MADKTIGINIEQVQHAVKGINLNANQITMESVDWYQKNVIEKLCLGWVTVTGKERIAAAANTLNTVLSKVKQTGIDVVTAIEDSASTIARGADTTYPKIGADIDLKSFQSENAKDNVDGTNYIIVEYLKDAQVKLNQFISNRIEKNFSEMMADAQSCGLYDKDNGLQQRVNKLLTDMRTSSIEQIQSIIDDIDKSITWKSDEADQARAKGQAILDISASLK